MDHSWAHSQLAVEYQEQSQNLKFAWKVVVLPTEVRGVPDSVLYWKT